MKKIIILLLFVLPMLKTAAQAVAFTNEINQNGFQYWQQGGKEISKEEEEKILSKLSKETRAKLEEIKKYSKEKYQQLLRNNRSFSGLTYEVFADGGNNNLNLYNENLKKEKDINLDVELLALKCKNSDKESAQKYKNELSSKLSELFDLRESKKHDELVQLEKRIKDLKESLQERHDNKQEIMQRRIQELLGNPKNLNWE
jgi:hypothetical protein